MGPYLTWEKKRLFRLARNLEVTPSGAAYGWDGAKQFEKVSKAASKWFLVEGKLNDWWVGVVMGGCSQKAWDAMLAEMAGTYGVDAGEEFKSIFPQAETVGPGQSTLQKKIYGLGAKKSRCSNVDFSDVVDLF